jgi:hypothetical protein
MSLLDGSRQERTNEEARARIPMNASQVRACIDEMQAQTKSRAARLSMARHAISIGNITPEGKDVWREYLRVHG